MSTLELEHIKHTSSSSNNLSVHSDGTVVSNNKLGIGTVPNATFGSLLYAQGTPAVNKPIISGYSQGNSNNAGMALFNDSGNRGIWTTGSTMRFTRNYEGNSTTDMNIDASGRVTMPNQPAWWAQTYSTYAFTATGTLEFNSTNVGMTQRLDVGNNYDPTTGRFTAPVAGTYFVMLTCSASYGSNYLYLYIMKNGSDIISRNYAQNSQYLEQTLQVVTTLAVGDYVSCKTEKNYVGGALYGPSFCGFLIG